MPQVWAPLFEKLALWSCQNVRSQWPTLLAGVRGVARLDQTSPMPIMHGSPNQLSADTAIRQASCLLSRRASVGCIFLGEEECKLKQRTGMAGDWSVGPSQSGGSPLRQPGQIFSAADVTRLVV